MNNQEMLRVAMEQSAIDLHCAAEDFCAPGCKVVVSAEHPEARKYLTLPFECSIAYYGQGIVASVRPELLDPVRDYLEKYPAEHCFETPNLHALSEKLRPFGLKICFMAEYFLPDEQALRPLECGYEMRLLGPEAFAGLYLPRWSNALCEKRRSLDQLCVGAYDGEQLIGLAGASADCERMWQIGIDVLPEYRRQGIACALTSRLACEIMARGKVPFYCAAWSNVASVRNAIRSGFRPAWVEMTAKPEAYVDALNQ